MKKLVVLVIVFNFAIATASASENGFETYTGRAPCYAMDSIFRAIACMDEQDAKLASDEKKFKARSAAATTAQDRNEVLRLLRMQVATLEAEDKIADASLQRLKLKRPQLSVGMTKKQAGETRWGKPEKVIYSSSVNGTVEMWIFDESHTALIQDGRVVNVTIIR